MYELIQVSEHDYYIDCPAKLGLIQVGSAEAVLIDSGSDKDAGKKALRILQDRGWTLKAIYNTHSHADHIGGNRFLQEKTGCAVYAFGMECAYTNAPLLEPIGLYGGYPFKELRHKFLLAQESSAQQLTEAVLPEGVKLLSLPGHSFDMVGFLTGEGTAYIADSVSSEETLSKYGIGYLWDADAALKTLEALPEIPAKCFVPSHAPAVSDISALAKLNAEAINAVMDRITALCSESVGFEALLKRIFDIYGLNMTAQQYALIGSTLRSYLSCLYGRGRLAFEFSENEMLWKAV